MVWSIREREGVSEVRRGVVEFLGETTRVIPRDQDLDERHPIGSEGSREEFRKCVVG